MSDPLGRHFCNHAGDVNDMNGETDCKILGRRTQCCGVVEECVQIECPRCHRHDDALTIWSLGECIRCDHIRGDVEGGIRDNEDETQG